MDALARERDRLLQRTARVIGLTYTALAFVCFLLPGVVAPDILIAIVPLFIILMVCLVLVGNSNSFLLTVGGLVSGVAILAVAQLSDGEQVGASARSAMVLLGGGGLSAFALILTNQRRRAVTLALSFAATMALMMNTSSTAYDTARTAVIVTLGWGMMTVAAYWLSAGVPRAARRIMSIGRAHRAERRASETEAQRRQGARLLHDTVLATLTLLAHSGVGVSSDAMRQQAADDARLLRQLRLGMAGGATPVVHTMEPVSETPLGTTLESVKQRFGGMGLDVAWHGTGHVLLPSEVLDAFLLALSECLENVRRHAGVTNAHVTITEDDTTVKAMVTDQGVGFDLEAIEESRLGFKESIVGRLREVGGNARLFSAPGAGTTVVLEVPRP